MGATDFQLGVADETTYGTAVTVTRFFEYNEPSTPIQPRVLRTRGNPLRAGSAYARSDRSTPYFDRGEGTIALDVMNKGFGFWLKHMLGQVATSGAGPFVHTATEADFPDSFTAQFNYPLNPSDANQAVTFSGGRVNSWTLSNSIDGNLVAELECDFNGVTTATALASASYPADMENLTWAGGVVTVGGTTFDVSEVSIQNNNNLATDRRFIRGNTARKEPKGGRRELSVAFTGEFDDLTFWNHVNSTTLAGSQTSFTAKWTLGAASLEVSIPVLTFDAIDLGGELGAVDQAITAVGGANGTDEPISIIYTNTDAAA